MSKLTQIIRGRRATKKSLDEGRQDEGRQGKSRQHQRFFPLAQELLEGFVNYFYRVFSVVSHESHFVSRLDH